MINKYITVLGWIIVEKAYGDHWVGHFNNDPKINGALEEHSCFGKSDAANLANVEDYYINKEDAKRVCRELNSIDTYGEYAVCPLIERFSDFNYN